MKKKLLKNIKELKKELKADDQIKFAFDVLEQAINEQIMEPKKLAPGVFETPAEVVGNANAVATFSDGGCRGNPGPGAWGIVVQEYDGRVVHEASDFKDYTTNNQMELTGALKCMEYVKANMPLKSDIYVYTDSKYVVDGMKTWVEGWKKRGWKKADRKAPENLELWQSLDAIRHELGGVNFLWVKGHAGHPQNERCDELANESMDANI
jgi:ribonuclease HI